MKTLKALTAAVLIVISSSAFATDNEKNEKATINYTLQKYIGALSYGKINGISEVLDPQAQFTVTGMNKTIHYNTAQILSSLKGLKNVQQNCLTSYNIIELNPTQAIVKVTMKYDAFSRVDFVNIANTSDGWKITNASTSFLKN
jgi:hypothetical protein